jgi:hypothetical protein
MTSSHTIQGARCRRVARVARCAGGRERPASLRRGRGEAAEASRSGCLERVGGA